ncbi:hypothetical protein PV10_05070 [Exophiala mesophila]|uniref:Probable quinone oxidoreductase n=1 Tax=Exophiala mesophila TaxID=212818 RepID=A0A0D1Y057_EXOME|nr:uncharacterized protein PV10_05070 [Exophiala mesophila]KIV93891.1 hypothetical protein PV10_05070 [Exophiala mesophila]
MSHLRTASSRFVGAIVNNGIFPASTANRLATALLNTTSSKPFLTCSYSTSFRARRPASALHPNPLKSFARMASSVPSTQRAILVPENGSADVLTYVENHPVPTLSDGQVLVKNTYSGVNFIDTYFRTGLYPAPGGLPLVIGQEAAGTIAKVPVDNPLNFKVGERVVWIAGKGYAEYTAVNADRVIRIPDGVSDEKAVGGFLMGLTALSLIKEAYPVKSGDTILVHAAAGGMGLLLLQLLKAIPNVTIIATAGGPEKCQLAKETGATHVIDYKASSGPTWVEQVLKLTDGKGVDATFDGVGKDTYEGSLEVAKRKSKVVYYGNASGAIPPFNIARLAAKNVSIMRSTLMNYIVTREELEYYANDLLDLIKNGKLNIRIHKIYDLKDAATAHKDLEGRKTTGKLLLKL